MDWIEHVFHVSPDGGTGWTEMLILVAVLLAIAGVMLTVRWTRAFKRERLRDDPSQRLP